MWPIAIALGVVAGLVLAKLGRLIRVGGRTLALLAVAAGGWFWYRQRGEAADRDAARERIPLASVEMAHVTLTPQSNAAGRYALAARIRNRSSAYTLSGVDVSVTIRDCVAGAPCETIAQHVQHIRLTVPPGQSRDVRDEVVLPQPPIARGRFAWSHEIVSTEGREGAVSKR